MIETTPLYALAPSFGAEVRGATAFQPPAKRAREVSAVAVVQVSGTLFKSQLVYIRDDLKRLSADPTVGEIVLHIDSPGGEVRGTADCASAVAWSAAKKPVTAFIEDMGGSAAYWIASQATRVIANRTAVVGSIGAFIVVADTSKFWEKLGVEWIVIKSSGGGQKGGLVDGIKISEECLSGLQRRVDAVARIFIGDVAKGRRQTVERVRDIADGRVFVGAAAQAAGLVDEISTLDGVLEAARVRTLHLARGPAALAAFNELVTIETSKHGYASETWRAVVAERHPELAAAASEQPAAQSLQPSTRWRD